MVMTVTRAYAADAVAGALAAELCCAPSDFGGVGVSVFELRDDRAVNPLVRRFPTIADSLTVASMGGGVVVGVSARWAAWARDLFGGLDADGAFSLQTLGAAARRMHMDGSGVRLNGPYAYSVTSERDWVRRDAPYGYAVSVGGPELLAGLLSADFPNAVAPRRGRQGRPDVAAAVAVCGGAVVGVASVSADSDALWQIGVDVRAAHRGVGLGAALASAAGRAVLDAGRVPYYGTSVNNIASRRAAQSAGFYPCWVAAFTMGG